MLHSILVVLRARLLIAKNVFWRYRLIRKIAFLALILFLGGGAYAMYWLLRATVEAIRSPQFAEALEFAAAQNPQLSVPTDVRPFLDALPSIGMFLALILLVLTSFSTVLSSLYLSGDIDMLLVAPVPMRAVFIVKFFGGLLVPYLLLFLLLGPALLGYGQGMSFGPAYVLVAIVTLVLFPLLPTGLGALLVMAVVRVIPARRAREIVGVLGALLGASWYIVNQFAPEIAPRIANVETFDSLRRLNIPVLPSAWAGRALVAAGQGEWLTLLVYGGLFAGLSVGVFVLCVLLAERLYYTGWSNMAVQGGRVRARKAPHDAPARLPGRLLGVLRFLPEEARAIVYKDLRVFPRDLRNVQQLIFPLVLAGLWTFQLLTRRAPASGQGGAEINRYITQIGPAGISFFICLSISGVLGGPSISREGRSIWLLRVAPISTWHLLIGKFALAYLPFPAIGTLFVAFLSIVQQATPLDFVRSLLLVLLIGLGTTSIGIGLGAGFPRFDWENPRQQVSSVVGCLTGVCYMVYMAVALAVVLGMPALEMLLPQFGLMLQLAGWALLTVLTAGIVWGTLSFGKARLDRIEIS